MNYWQRLWRVELIALASLCVFAAAIAFLLVLEGLVMSPMESDYIEIAVMGFAFTFLYGFIPVIFFGAPIYSALIASGRFNWTAMLVVSVLPGIAILFFHTGLGAIGIVGGVCVLFMVHTAVRRRLAHRFGPVT